MVQRRLTRLFFGFILLVGCGVLKEEYRKYGDDAAGAGEKTVCEAALTAFKESVGPMVTRCKTCHAPGAPYESVLSFNDDDNVNRLKLRGAKDGTAAGIYSYISGTSHAGASEVKPEDENNLKTWFTAEETCPAGSDGLQP